MSPEPDDLEAERRLVERFLRGDRRAFDEIVLRHRLPVYRVVRRLLGNHDDADEATQETFVKAWSALSGFRGESRLSTWLVRIALNTARSIPRGRRQAADAAGLVGAPDPSESPLSTLERGESRRRVRRAVATLPPRQREVVTLKVYSDLTYEEVAAVMGLTVGAVKAHFHQAVANLRRHLAPGGVRA